MATWAVKHGYPIHLIDIELSHVLGNAITRAYIRPEDQLIEERAPMMQAWADFLDAPPVHENVLDDCKFPHSLV
jgi:hypothetical protein